MQASSPLTIEEKYAMIEKDEEEEPEVVTQEQSTADEDEDEGLPTIKACKKRKTVDSRQLHEDIISLRTELAEFKSVIWPCMLNIATYKYM